MSDAIFNPHNKPVDELPFIYGFNNGGSHQMLMAQLLAADGTAMGSHCCSHECYMRGDLGIEEGHRADRHEYFQKHYPDGYRMAFVKWEHEGLQAAYRLNQAQREDAQ